MCKKYNQLEENHVNVQLIASFSFINYLSMKIVHYFLFNMYLN